MKNNTRSMVLSDVKGTLVESPLAVGDLAVWWEHENLFQGEVLEVISSSILRVYRINEEDIVCIQTRHGKVQNYGPVETSVRVSKSELTIPSLEDYPRLPAYVSNGISELNGDTAKIPDEVVAEMPESVINGFKLVKDAEREAGDPRYRNPGQKFKISLRMGKLRDAILAANLDYNSTMLLLKGENNANVNAA